MVYSDDKAKDLENAIFLGGAILSNEWLAIVMVLENGQDMLEGTPPVRTFLIPYGEDNFKIESRRIKWDTNKWVFPMIVKDNNNKFVMVGNNGGSYNGGLHGGEGEKNIRINKEIQNVSDFQGLKNIHGTIYVVGNFRQVIRREGIESWSDISAGDIQEDAKKRYNDTFHLLHTYKSGFNCIDGFEAHKNLYAAGQNSDVWKYTGTNWVPIDIGVLGENIISICCAEDGFVYIGTVTGKLIKGRDGSWKEIKTPFKSYPLTAIAYFEKKIYLSTENRLYEYKQDKISTVKYNIKDGSVPRRAGSLDIAYGRLLSIGSTSIAIYDGKQWEILYGSASKDFQTVIDDVLS